MLEEIEEMQIPADAWLDPLDWWYRNTTEGDALVVRWRYHRRMKG